MAKNTDTHFEVDEWRPMLLSEALEFLNKVYKEKGDFPLWSFWVCGYEGGEEEITYIDVKDDKYERKIIIK